MKRAVGERLEKAERAIRAARVQLDADLPDFALSDAYYAMLYSAEALLMDRGLTFRSHRAVHAAFGKEFAKPKLIVPKHHRHLIDAFQKRNEADYGMAMDTEEQAAEEVIGWAEELLEAARDYLTGEGHDGS